MGQDGKVAEASKMKAVMGMGETSRIGSGGGESGMKEEGIHDVLVEEADVIFTEPELRAMEGFSRGGPDHVEVKCGCTSKRYGDCIGVLTVYSNGQFLITCQCNSCYQDPSKVYTPYEFEKHGRGEGNSKWKSHLWVMKNGKKLAIWRTELYKYYRHSANGGSGCMRRQFHRDEFMSCTLCGKQRRFRQRNKQQCRNYHDALLSQPTWKCADIRKRCRDAEERDSRKKFRGCPRTGSCKGCTTCVCLGCLTCRFVDCNCRTCLDFMQNADP